MWFSWKEKKSDFHELLAKQQTLRKLMINEEHIFHFRFGFEQEKWNLLRKLFFLPLPRHVSVIIHMPETAESNCMK